MIELSNSLFQLYRYLLYRVLVQQAEILSSEETTLRLA